MLVEVVAADVLVEVEAADVLVELVDASGASSPPSPASPPQAATTMRRTKSRGMPDTLGRLSFT